MKKFLIFIAAVIVVVIVVSVLAPGKQEIPITTASDQARTTFLEGREQLENIRIDEAREIFEQAIGEDPDFALAHLYRAFTATSATDFRKHLDNATALTANVSEGERLLIQGTQANADNNPLEAVTLFEQLVELHPQDKRAHWTLGGAYGGREEYDKAVAHYEKALEIDRDFAPPYNNLGYTYFATNEFGKAEEAFQNYIRLLPNEANPHDSLADLYTRMGRHQEAIEHYQKALELNPTFAFSQRKIGTNLVFLGKYDEGREAFHKAMEREATPAGKVIDMRMVAYSKLYEGKHKEALAEADKALEVAAENELANQLATIHTEKCRIYVEASDVRNARKSLAESSEVVMASDLSAAIKENFARAMSTKPVSWRERTPS
jgi:tetratricopeptide (TPR) repeat protein